ncbi:hypothetical protein BD769DRAFT_1386120 [Suillus cothurnatus]|nr:hypothetical protein BD769DRAFT_1386120 [Suillus cothurnatus]
MHYKQSQKPYSLDETAYLLTGHDEKTWVSYTARTHRSSLFCIYLSSLTHRRNVLDPAKLAYLNKHHLMRSLAAHSMKRGLSADDYGKSHTVPCAVTSYPATRVFIAIDSI